MRKWKIIALVALGLLLLNTGVAGAGGRHESSWWNKPEYREALKLTNGEIKQLNHVYEALSLDMIKLKGQVETARLKLEFMLEREDLDQSAMEAEYKRLEEARAALSRERFDFYVQVRKIVGPQRFSQLMEILKERRGSHK
jgi:Spy/CpxP family protein refolding chaperone